MLQILSTSNETSTGPELVQNGNFSELGSDLVQNGDFGEIGSELVTNGDFSDTGSNLVDNPNFTETGSELVTNGDFATDSTDWTKINGATISGGKAIINGDGSTFTSISQASIFTEGKSYIVTADVTITSGLGLKFQDGANNENIGFATTSGSYTYYFVATSNATLVIGRRTGGTAFESSVDNVSVKELGEDWIENELDPDSVSFGENGLTIVQSSDLGDNSRAYQSAVTSDDKSYKVTYTIFDSSYTSTNKVQYWNGSSYVDLPEQGAGTHVFYYTREGTQDTWIFNLRATTDAPTDFVTISSIIVQELGEGWTLSNDVSVGEDKLICDNVAAYSSIASQSGTVPTEKSVKVTYDVVVDSGAFRLLLGSGGTTTEVTTSGTKVFYETSGTGGALSLQARGGGFDGSVTNISVKEVGQDWTVVANAAGDTVTFGDSFAEWTKTDPEAVYLQQNYALSLGVFHKLKYTILSNTYTGGGTELGVSGVGAYGQNAIPSTVGTHTVYLKVTNTTPTASLRLYSNDTGGSLKITDISVQQLDPNGYWTLGTGWSIGADKAISTVTGSDSDITQSILTAGKTYRTVYEIVDYTAGTAQAIVTGSEGADAVAIETYTEDLTTTGTDFSIRSKLGTFDGSVSSVSVKQLGTYEDQSIYVTAADVQTIAQASVYYLIELTSMGSKNSLYFLPSSVVANNGRYTKLNFTVISKDALPQPTVGIISFYDSVGGFDTYPMGFYEFRIYEQTSSTNLDPTLATGLLEKGFAFVRDFSGNMQELTDGFKEYNPTLTQYVYSK